MPGIEQQIQRSPARLPDGIAQALEEAIQRTGDTPALQRARQRLPVILSMRPEMLEAFTADVYSALD